MPRKKINPKPQGAPDDGYMGEADPIFMQVVMAEIEDELALREGILKSPVEPPEPHALTHAEWASRSYLMVQRWRHRKLIEFEANPELIELAYATEPVKFICHWCDIYEPRNAGKGLPTRFPFVLFKRQEELLQFFHACVIAEGNGLVEKSRDMGATWCGVGYSTWSWLFVPGMAVGWGSATSDKLDRLGDASSIFEKMRLCIRGLPKIFKPFKFKEDHMMHKRIVNPANGSSIVGDIGDNIGRGGRTRLYFVDESAYLERPDSVEAALSENTRVRIDISSVSAPGTVFHRTRQAGVEWAPGKPIDTKRHNVFIMDYRDHPEKSEEWASNKKESFESRGLGHVYAREIGRNYAATTEGALINPEWVEAIFDAHKVLDLPDMDLGPSVAGLDVADGGEAANAFSGRTGRVIKKMKLWNVRDPAITARTAVTLCTPFLPCELQYDSIGVGAGVKGECNRLGDEGLLSPQLVIVPWNGGAAVLDPFGFVVPGDPKSMTNKDYYANIKAQAWDRLRQFIYNTWRAVVHGEKDKYKLEELISIDTTMVDVATRHKLRDELCQVRTTTATARLKMAIIKSDHDRNSPNLAESLVICIWPMPAERNTGFITDFAMPVVIRA